MAFADLIADFEGVAREERAAGRAKTAGVIESLLVDLLLPQAAADAAEIRAADEQATETKSGETEPTRTPFADAIAETAAPTDEVPDNVT